MGGPVRRFPGGPPLGARGVRALRRPFRAREFTLDPAALAYSRRNEFEADRFATEALGTGRDLATGLKKLSADSLANLTPHPFYVWLHHTHPPLVERLAALHKL
jgi:Zn-dependent protease with chaperone function